MKRVFWFTVVAIVLLSLAALGWIVSFLPTPSLDEPSGAHASSARPAGRTGPTPVAIAR